jgi:hypothetical protein
VRYLVLCALLLVTAACSSGVAQPAAVPSSAPVALAGSCTGTAITQGGAPSWADAAGVHINPTGLPLAVDQAQTVVGFLYGYPLRAGHPTSPTNKVLWVVRLPRDRSDLTITAHPVGAASPVITVVQAADSGPGEIYPSVVDVPTPGCWVLDLAWSSHRTTLQLPYS